jgi:nitrate reductase gamma subunit
LKQHNPFETDSRHGLVIALFAMLLWPFKKLVQLIARKWRNR